MISVGVEGTESDPAEYFDQDEVYDDYYDDYDDGGDSDGAAMEDTTNEIDGDEDDAATAAPLIEDTDIHARGDRPSAMFNERMRGIWNAMDDTVGILKEIAGNLDCQQPVVCSAPFQMVRSGECLYFNLDHHKTWSGAREYCQALGADLAEPVTVTQDLEYIMRLSVTTMIHMGHDRLWVGASDIDKEGVWQWVSGNLVTQDIGWTINHPRDITGKEDCMAMIFTHPPGVKALTCNTRKPFVCQKHM